ncbi:MAG: glycosyltransferase family 2 protein [Planctomycetes bacterium]|nr:glycosyltransferase family 2 protein [Planctomycetota bacterium]
MTESQKSDYNTISLVIPCFNEEGNIRNLAKAIAEVKLPAPYILKEALFIDDGSTDRTVKVIKEVQGEYPFIQLIRFERNFGQTSALSAGFDHSTGALIICLDADLQNDPADIPKMLAKLDEGYDVVSGWRKDREDPWLRTQLSKVANHFIAKTTGLHLHDYGCTLKIYRKKHVNRIKLYGEMHRFIPIYLQTVGAKVTEIPVNHSPRHWGTSKYGLNRTFKVVFDLMVIRFLNKYSNRPIYLFGIAGSLSIAVSFISGFYGIYNKIAHDVSLIQTPVTFMSLISFFMGIMFILLGLLAELLMRVYYESQGKSTYIVRQ